MRLIFVYNANSDLFSSVTDYARKLLKPDTYQCNLCKITYDNLGMKKRWKRFIKDLEAEGHEIEFLHKDELEANYGSQDVPLPCCFSVKNSDGNEKERKKLRLLIPANEIDKAKNIDDMMGIVRKSLSEVSSDSSNP